MMYLVPVKYDSSRDSYYVELSPLQLVELGIAPSQSLAIERHAGVETLTVHPFYPVQQYLVKCEELVETVYQVSAASPEAAMDYVKSPESVLTAISSSHTVLNTTIHSEDPTPAAEVPSSLDGLKPNPYLNPNLL